MWFLFMHLCYWILFVLIKISELNYWLEQNDLYSSLQFISSQVRENKFSQLANSLTSLLYYSIITSCHFKVNEFYKHTWIVYQYTVAVLLNSSCHFPQITAVPFYYIIFRIHADTARKESFSKHHIICLEIYHQSGRYLGFS